MILCYQNRKIRETKNRMRSKVRIFNERGGRVYELKIRLKSASVEVEVEIEAKLGKRGAYCDMKGYNVLYLAMQ